VIVYVIFCIAVLGALIGSFLNVVIYRVPAGKSIVSPPSACGSCGHEVRPYDNIPVVSWLVLRGKCRDCGSRISIRYPLVELGGLIFFAIVAVRFVPSMFTARGTLPLVADIIALVAFLYLSAISLALALIDLDVCRLPNAIVLPAYGVGALLLGASSVLSGDYWSLARAAIGCAALGLIYLVLAVAVPGGMGFGDVKLAGVLGLFLGWLGWAPLIVGALLAFVLGGLFGIALIIIRRGGRKTAIPFGPWMLAGAWIGILVGTPLAAGYLSLFALA
jgi:leader peptidase (prepilin peptidase)/N-methyltransferase